MASISGTSGNDPALTGSDDADVIFGFAGEDTIAGAGGNDFLSGGTGSDSINTGAGDDVVVGGGGNDTIGGMAGSDFIQADAGDDFVAWNDPIGDAVFGGTGNDILLGGNIAADTIDGGDGDDLIRAFATSPENATAPDLLLGGSGNDVIIGGNAADTIEGGRLDDELTGNAGADTFFFEIPEFGVGTGVDKITDFVPTEDVVTLVGVDAGFDPLAALSQTTAGTVLDLGDGNSILFTGRVVAEFNAADFDLIA